jgi:hypothetical protein
VPTNERYGAYWYDDEGASGWAVVFERYEPVLDLLATVSRKGPLFKAVIYGRIGAREYRLPMWCERRPEALFDSQPEAIEHLNALLAGDESRA